MGLESRALLVAYFLVISSVHVVAALGDGQRGQGYLVVHLLASAIFARLWCMSRGEKGRFFLSVFWVGVLSRLVLIPVVPFTSHDVHRYLWDGHVAALGHDPYLVSPHDVADGWGGRPPDNSGYVTLYPPLAIFFFRWLAVLGFPLAISLWKTVVGMASIATLFLLRAILLRRGFPRGIVLAALFPIVVLEAGVGAHLDVLSTGALVLAIFLFDRSVGWSGVSLGAGVLLKLSPGLALGPLAASPRGRAVALYTAIVVFIGYLIARACGWSALGSLGQFLLAWQFGSPLHALSPSRPLLAAVGLLAIVLLLWRSRREEDRWRAVLWTFAIALAVSPVAFPWYFLPLAAMVSIFPSAGLMAWMTAVPFTYEVIDGYDLTKEWSPSSWPLYVILATWLFAAGVWLWQSLPKRSKEAARLDEDHRR